MLTAAAGMVGAGDVAKVALRELRRAQPNISLAWIADQMPIKWDADRERYLEGFHRAAWSKVLDQEVCGTIESRFWCREFFMYARRVVTIRGIPIWLLPWLLDAL